MRRLLTPSSLSDRLVLLACLLAAGLLAAVVLGAQPPLLGGGLSLLLALLAIQLISQRRKRVARAASATAERGAWQQRLQLAAGVFTHAREGIMITDVAGLIVDVNEAFEQASGYTRDELVGQSPRLLHSGQHDPDFYKRMNAALLAQGHWSGEIWDRRKDGQLFASLETISAVRDEQGQITHFITLMTDITALKQQSLRLEHLAHYDPLTRLPNRVLLADRLQQAMVVARRHDTRVAVVYLDLDGFKDVNDQYGHDMGDRLLTEIAARLRQVLRAGDTLARLGGDEFVAVLLDLPDVQACQPLLVRMLREISRPLLIDDRSLQVSGSLGVTLYPQSQEVDAAQLMRQADQAMYAAKLAGKNRVELYDSERDQALRGQHQQLDALREAFERGEFLLHYQPVVELASGRAVAMEALIRWQQPQRGLLGSDAFMPQTEGTPLGVEVGEWVLRQALADGALWRAQGLALNLHVNVCASHLLEPNFVSRVLLALAERRLQPQDLTLELQETSAVADLARVSRVLDDARNQGLSFALDDFGTGQSSLIGLKHLPVAQLKIDPSVVRDMLDAADDLAILDAILGLAAAFRLETVAEGVESLEHGAMLLQLGCQFAQGYAMARPMPAAAVPGWVAQWARPTAWQGLTPLPHEALPLLRGSIDDRARRRALWRQLELGAAPVGRFDLRDSLLGTWLAGARDAEALRELHLRIHDMGVELQRARERGEPLDGNTVQAMRSAEAELETRLRERLSGRPA